MNLRWWLWAMLIVICGGGLIAQKAPRGVSSPSSGVFAFVNVNVIPLDRERLLERQTVIVRDDRIVSIVPTTRSRAPRDATLIDGSGKFLMPGLADLHIHLRSTDELLSYLAYGVTTVMHLSGATGGAPDLLGNRAALARGELLGPTLYASGPTLDGDPPIFPNVSVAVRTPEDARRVVAEQKRAGYDLLKVYNRLAPEVYDALLTAAMEQGLAVVGHVPRQVGMERALRSGQAMIAHGEEYFFTYFGGANDAQMQGGVVTQPDERKIAGIAEATRAASVAVTPNLSFIASTKRQLEDLSGVFADAELRYLHPNARRMWQANNPTRRRDLDQFTARERVKYPFVRRLTKGLSDAGVLLLLGTDSSAPGLFPGQSAHLELRELVAAGLTPYQALATGTSNAGRFVAERVRPADKFGVVAVGHRADLLLLESNPLERIENISTLVGVMARGEWLTKDRLQQLREGLAESYKQVK